VFGASHEVSEGVHAKPVHRIEVVGHKVSSGNGIARAAVGIADLDPL